MSLHVVFAILLIKFVIAGLLWLTNELTDGQLWRDFRSLFPAAMPA